MSFSSGLKSFVFKDIVDEKSDAAINKLSRWSVFLFVLFSALLTILYVSNVMHIDNLLGNLNKQKAKYDLLKNENELLKTRLNKLQSPHRIKKIAQEKLGMRLAENPPQVLE